MLNRKGWHSRGTCQLLPPCRTSLVCQVPLPQVPDGFIQDSEVSGEHCPACQADTVCLALAPGEELTRNKRPKLPTSTMQLLPDLGEAPATQADKRFKQVGGWSGRHDCGHWLAEPAVLWLTAATNPAP